MKIVPDRPNLVFILLDRQRREYDGLLWQRLDPGSASGWPGQWQALSSATSTA